jgi:heme iron utilization protein
LNELETASQGYRQLRDGLKTTQIASQGGNNEPQSSYAPFVWHDRCLYLYLSELAQHTQNLRRNPAVSLMLIEDENAARNPFARKRISLQGRAQIVSRDDPLFVRILDKFGNRFGSVMEVIAPLPDFHLFRIEPLSGQYVQGFGQAYRLGGEHLDTLEHIDPRQG